jgi:glycosyltransferase involved in cell wall biosynthesis
MIRVGFPFSATDDGWLGGLNYFRSLFGAILGMQDRQIEPVILIGDPRTREILKQFPPIPIVESAAFAMPRRWPIPRSIGKRLLGLDIATEMVLKRHRIAALSHAVPLGRTSRIPVMSWIPDFQHVHLPEFFSVEEVEARNSNFAFLADQADRVLLSSCDAQRDFCALYPALARKSRVLPFVADIPEAKAATDQAKLTQRYEIGEPYFLVPNQFWAHKNHRLIIEALAILEGGGRAPLVLATGNLHDYRWPNYHADLMKLAQHGGVSNRFRVLGVVPRADLIALMMSSIAIINPSKFEGWSTTIEEAKALGLKTIVSDIAVHREQAPPGGLYVDAERPQELANAMKTLLARGTDTPRPGARMEYIARRHAFATGYQQIVLEMVAGAQAKKLRARDLLHQNLDREGRTRDRSGQEPR